MEQRPSTDTSRVLPASVGRRLAQGQGNEIQQTTTAGFPGLGNYYCILDYSYTLGVWRTFGAEDWVRLVAGSDIVGMFVEDLT